MALKGTTKEEKIWNYLKSKGLNNFAAAGIMGNLYAESGLIPNRVEALCLQRLREKGKAYTDITYTAAIDSGKISKAEFLNPLPGKQYGFGLAQWTSPSRKTRLYDTAKAKKVSIGDLENSLDFLWWELNNTYVSVLNTLKTVKSVKKASNVVLKKFECPSDTSAPVQNARASYAQKYYDKYAARPSCAQAYDINKLIEIASAEIGYLEKASDSNLDSKTANAGSANYTKYWRDMANLGLGNYQAQYWCACFVSWCFYKAFGLAAAQSLLLQKFFINCQAMYTLAAAKKQIDTSPKVGDVVLFWTSSTSQYGHTGIVVSVSSDGKTFTTIEGNTSGGSAVVANGGGVAKKTYTLANLTKVRFMRPNYGTGINTSFDKSLAGTYHAAARLRLRSGAGSDKTILCVIPKGGKMTCSGYYSVTSAGIKWYFVAYGRYTGFVSGKYVKR